MFFCGRCDSSFEIKADLAAHLRNHPDATPMMPTCGTCNWHFGDSLALQAHQIQTGHTGMTADSPGAPSEVVSEAHYCDRCSTTFGTVRDFRRHRKHGQPCCDSNFSRTWKSGASKEPSLHQRLSYVDLDAPKAPKITLFAYEDTFYPPSESIVTETYCKICKKTFESSYLYNRHALACTSKEMPPVGAPVDTKPLRHMSSFSHPTTSQQALRAPSGAQGRGGHRSRDGSKSPLPRAQQPHPQPAGHAGRGKYSSGDRGDGGQGTSRSPLPAARQSAYTPSPPQAIPPNDEMANLQQAKFICGKIMRLVLQVDIFLHEAGEILVAGTGWARVPVSRQPAVTEKLETMCHLPRVLQSMEFLPAPKTLQNEYTAEYSITEFQHSPDRNPSKPALDVVALSCSKIELTDGRHEVVKIAAVNALTCQILMSHFVCTNTNANVKNWNKPTTGLSSFSNFEDARKAGFKVLKGWAAARSALSKFVDKETIIVGHNLRADLDALRMIHGRAVDVVKVIEKAAQGPLSKAQVTLDGWCRDFINTPLKIDPVFGRNCLTDAFAAREIVLRAAKLNDDFVRITKQKSQEYQVFLKA